MKTNKTIISLIITLLTVATLPLIGCDNFESSTKETTVDIRPIVELSPPNNLRIQNNILSWNPISVANGYTIRIQCSQNNMKPIYHISIAGAGTSFNLSTLDLPYGIYYISMRSNRRYYRTTIFDYSIFSESIVFKI